VAGFFLRHTHADQRAQQATRGRTNRGPAKGASQDAAGQNRTDPGDQPGCQRSEDTSDYPTSDQTAGRARSGVAFGPFDGRAALNVLAVTRGDTNLIVSEPSSVQVLDGLFCVTPMLKGADDRGSIGCVHLFFPHHCNSVVYKPALALVARSFGYTRSPPGVSPHLRASRKRRGVAHTIARRPSLELPIARRGPFPKFGGRRFPITTRSFAQSGLYD